MRSNFLYQLLWVCTLHLINVEYLTYHYVLYYTYRSVHHCVCSHLTCSCLSYLPCCTGHEISGTVVAIGPNQDPVKSKTLHVGQRVISPFIMPCGACYHCVRGREDICETFFDYNRLKGQLYDGTTRLYRQDNTPVAMYSMAGLAEYCVVPSTAVFELPQTVPFSEASIIGCAIFTAYGAVRHGADLRGGESVAVIGAGGVGANVLQFARAFGASRVIAIDVSDDKLSAMAALGTQRRGRVFVTHTIG